MRVITDFDGPIMDLTDRYYHVYRLCLARVKDQNQSLADPLCEGNRYANGTRIEPLSQAEFWQRKRARVPEQQIGIDSGLTPTQAEAFKQMRDLHAHQLQYLYLDRVVPGAIAALEQIQAAGIELIVMTLRRTSQLNVSLEQHDLVRFFPPQCRYCREDDYIKQGDIQDKTKLMAQALADLGAEPATWMVGDTEADIIAAQTYDIPVIGVLSGIRDREHLERYQPNKIVPDLAAAVRSILHK
jgi:phosphoglycolate phosphatase-like HAD superfamily hydrolase